MHVRSREEVKGVWKNHFECLVNENTEREAIVSSMGMVPMERGGKRVCAEGK